MPKPVLKPQPTPTPGPKVVLWLQNGRAALRPEVASMLRRLRRSSFTVVVVRGTAPFEGELRTAGWVGIVISDDLAQAPVSSQRALRTLPPVIIVAPRRVKGRLTEFKLLAEDFRWIDPAQVDRLMLRFTLSAYIDSFMGRCWEALADHLLLAGYPRVREMLKRALEPPTALAPPLGSVKGAAVFLGLTPRRLQGRWRSLQDAAPVALPQLHELLRVIVFLRGLSLWLMVLTVRDCAARVETSVDRLTACFQRYAGARPRDVDIADLPQVVFRLQREVFGWLLSGSDAEG